MKAIMLTIRLKWFYLTYKGIKTIEVRKSAPKDFAGDVYEVVSKTNFEKDLMEIPENEREFFKQFKGKVGLKFTLNKITHHTFSCSVYVSNDKIITEKACLTNSEVIEYMLSGKKDIRDDLKCYAWHISNLIIFDKPKELGEFKHYNKPHCDGCPFQYSALCEYHIEVECDDIPLTKAPQSYCFIEVKE